MPSIGGHMHTSTLIGDYLVDGVVYEPGVYYDISDDVYHRINGVSSTALKESRRSLRHFEHFINNGNTEEKAHLEFGYLCHLAILQKDLFQERTIITDIESKASKAYKDIAKLHPDKRVLSGPESDRLIGMMEALSKEKHCMDLIKDGRPEVTVLIRDPDTGLNLKGRFDWVSTNPNKPYILDYKTTQDAKPTNIPDPDEFNGFIRSSKFEKNANSYGYENQGAFYMYVAKLAKIKASFFSILAQEKEAPYVMCPYVYEPETLQEATDENAISLARIYDAIKMQKFPGYSDKPVVLARPEYARTGK
jgi:PDDEXK-like domain of unknown function (DUF3799)